MKATTDTLRENARAALDDAPLRAALTKLTGEGFPKRRLDAISRLPEFDQLRADGRAIKEHVLDNLDTYLIQFEEKVAAAGGTVHWARDKDEACRVIEGILADKGAKVVTKGKSMVTEEIGLNDYLEQKGYRAVETDLGEYIIQLRHEPPSHIIAPAIHLSLAQVADTFRQRHDDLAPDRPLDQPRQLLEEARGKLRHDFLTADVGITGANLLIAETGSAVIVTNEGNGDLTQSLPKTHIAVSSIEKVVPTLEDATTILRTLARSATGQDITVYTTFFTGARRPGDTDGPEDFHVVLVDGPRSGLLGGDFHDMLRCIKCGACMNHCPVYGAIGGHAYGWVYPGPMGSVLTPAFLGIACTDQLPGASTLCGRCEAVCPMSIPLPRMLRSWRARAFQAGQGGALQRFALATWAWLALRPRAYRLVLGAGMTLFKKITGRAGRARRLPPLLGAWTRARDFPAPEGGGFVARWHKTGSETNKESRT